MHPPDQDVEMERDDSDEVGNEETDESEDSGDDTNEESRISLIVLPLIFGGENSGTNQRSFLFPRSVCVFCYEYSIYKMRIGPDSGRSSYFSKDYRMKVRFGTTS